MNRIFTIFIFLVVLMSFGSGETVLDDYQGFEIPQYDSNEEILVEFVAPFLLIFMLMYLGLENALEFTKSENDPWNYRDESSEIRKMSGLIALIVAIAAIPTTFFNILAEYLAWFFGGITIAMLTIIGLAFSYLVWQGIRS